jgi:hypothetical protein
VASNEHPDRQNRCADLLRAGFGGISITVADTCSFQSLPGIAAIANTYSSPNYIGELFGLTPTDTPFLSAIGGLTGGRRANAVVHNLDRVRPAPTGPQPAEVGRSGRPARRDPRPGSGPQRPGDPPGDGGRHALAPPSGTTLAVWLTDDPAVLLAPPSGGGTLATEENTK